MTHGKRDARRIAEMSASFVMLSDKGKDSVLAILRALSFAQTVMGPGADQEERRSESPQSVRVG